MIRHGHTASELTGEVRILIVPSGHDTALAPQLFAGYGIAAAVRLEVECFIICACAFGQFPVPEAVGIVPEERKHLAVRHRFGQFRPPRPRIQRNVESDVLRHFLQGQKIRGGATVFVVKLQPQHRPVIFPLQAFHLQECLTIELPDHSHKTGVLGTEFHAALHHPVRKASATRLAVTERPYAQQHRHPLAFAGQKEIPQRTLPAPVIDSLLLLYVIPEKIGSEDVHPSISHFPDFPVPFVRRDARIVALSHDGKHPLAVHEERKRIIADFAAELLHVHKLANDFSAHREGRAVPYALRETDHLGHILPCPAVIGAANRAVLALGVFVKIHIKGVSHVKRGGPLRPIVARDGS